MINPRFMSNNILAADRALYKGHAVVAVAAFSRHVAEEALALIDVEYEVLPAVLDGREAMQEDAPLMHERLMPLANPHLRPGGLRDENDPVEGSMDIGGSRAAAAMHVAECGQGATLRWSLMALTMRCRCDAYALTPDARRSERGA